MTRWEYRVLHIPDFASSKPEKLEKIFNECGRDGWELVVIFFSHPAGDAILKRPLP